ncbi:MAG: S8 family serine peptidase [Anaerolineales bacterium]|nr:S8 family serine peptidase [Anaerolineales bacterium]
MPKLTKTLVFIALCIGLVWGLSGRATAAGTPIVVKLAPDVAIDTINAAYGTVTLETLPLGDQIYLLDNVGQSAAQLTATLTADSRVIYAEINQVGEAPEANSRDVYAWPNDGSQLVEVTEDPRLLYNWELDTSDFAHYINQKAAHEIRLTQSRSVNWGNGITVAVLDTGIDEDHPMLFGQISAAQYDFVDDDPIAADEFNGIDDDGDGYIDEVAGHGTHVAGLVLLTGPQVEILPLRVLDSDGRGDSFRLAEAILYAAANGADIINLSLGTTQNSLLLEDVIADVTAQGVLVIAAAGNLNSNAPQYPAAQSCTLAVTALDGKTRADYANYGDWVDVAAPGNHLNSTYPNNGVAWWDGTSMAAPLVAGQAAVLRSVNPNLTPAEIAQLITGTATSLDSNNNNYAGMLGSGRINMSLSLDYIHANMLPNTTNPLQGCNP